MHTVVISRNGYGNVWRFHSLRAARLNPIAQMDDVYASSPEELVEQYGRGLINDLLRFAEGRDRARLVDAFEIWRNGGSLSPEIQLLVWSKVSDAAKVPPTDPIEIVKIIHEDRSFREGRVLRSVGTDERSSSIAAKTAHIQPRKESEMAENRRRIKENSIITVVGKDGENPKRAGSKAFDRFALYENGMTVKQAKEAGVTASDITYDLDHEYITLEEVADEEAAGEAAPKKKRGGRKAADAEADTGAAAEAAE